MVKKTLKRWLSNKHEVHLSLVFMLIIIFANVEVFVHNSFFIQYKTAGIKPVTYAIEEFVNDGYVIEKKTVTSKKTDAVLYLHDVNLSVRRIQVNCINDASDFEAVSRLSYSTIDAPTAFTYVPINIITDDAMITLPTSVIIAEIQLALTNKLNDSIVCENLVLNPTPRFYLSMTKTPMYILVVLIFSFLLSMLSDEKLTKLGNRLGRHSKWVFVALLVAIDLVYPIIVTYDSAHYLWLADIFDTNSLNTWDPIRNAVYPFILYLSRMLFGLNQNAYLLPLILSHIVFFLLCCEIIIRVFKLDGIKRLWVSFSVFLLIALDPMVVGYFHTLLTEHLAATIAVMSGLIALNFYVSDIGSAKFYRSIIFFCIFVPLMWHVKQPYVGAAVFPFLIASLLKVINSRTKRLTWIVLGSYVAVALFTILSQVAWTGLLKNAGNALDESRQLSTWSERSLQQQSKLVKESPLKFIDQRYTFYLTAANFFKVSTQSADEPVERVIYTRPYAFQNSVIGMKIFKMDGKTSNLSYAPRYQKLISFLAFRGKTPEFFDRYFVSRSYISMFLFTSGYVFLPFYLLGSFIIWLKKRSDVRTMVLILLSTAFLNALGHTMFSYLDRYFFFGYPLILLAYLIDIFGLFSKLKKLVNNKKRRSEITAIPKNQIDFAG